jgi:hypothetical protein
MTAAVLRWISAKIGARERVSQADAKKIITDILDLIVLHVRDARGNHDERRTDVFANLLVEDGEEMVVVARDAALHSKEFHRHTPDRHPKHSMVAYRAIHEKSPLSIGDILRENRHAPRNKPYRSILALPVMGSEEGSVIGAISLDSSRPYFFQSFKLGAIEDSLENGLQPYVQTLALVLENLILRDGQDILSSLGYNAKGAEIMKGAT